MLFEDFSWLISRALPNYFYKERLLFFSDETQWAKSPKKQSVGVYFWVANLQKTHSFKCFFGNFAHWEQVRRKKVFKHSYTTKFLF